MKALVRAIEIPKFNKDRIKGLFPGYSLIGDPYGWFYPVEQTKVVVVSYGWSSLIEAVKVHLKGNGIEEPLTLELQMADFICQHVPEWCEEMNPEREQKVSAWKMMKSFYRAVEATWHEGQVSQEEADRRAAICAQCPKNVDQQVNFCIGCYARSLVSKVNDLLGSKRTAHDEKLKTCSACGCDLKLKTWIPKSGVADKTIDWPAHCWVRDSI
jgi:hypothetical protein